MPGWELEIQVPPGFVLVEPAQVESLQVESLRVESDQPELGSLVEEEYPGRRLAMPLQSESPGSLAVTLRLQCCQALETSQ